MGLWFLWLSLKWYKNTNLKILSYIKLVIDFLLDFNFEHSLKERRDEEIVGGHSL